MEKQSVKETHTEPLRLAVATEDGVTSDVRFKDLHIVNIYEYDPEKEEFIFMEQRTVDNKTFQDSDTSVTNSSGCGNGTGNGCHDESYIKDIIKVIGDCEYLLLGKIGPRASRTLLREGISVLEKGGKVNESLLQLSSYVTKRNRAMTKINTD